LETQIEEDLKVAHNFKEKLQKQPSLVKNEAEMALSKN